MILAQNHPNTHTHRETIFITDISFSKNGRMGGRRQKREEKMVLEPEEKEKNEDKGKNKKHKVNGSGVLNAFELCVRIKYTHIQK